MKTHYIIIMLLFAITPLMGLKCEKYVMPEPIPQQEQLPPATQEGKNTCGFLVNGKVWLPKGRLGNGQSNLSWWYDPGYNHGTFNIHGFRYEPSEGVKFSSFVIAIDNFSSIGIYNLKTAGRVTQYFDYNKNCMYYREDTITPNINYVNITRFDLTQRVIAGTFEFTLATPGCDTVRITQGRFDIKL